MKKLLITGASGFLGYHLMRIAASDFEVYGIFQSHDFSYPGTTPIRCDIRNYIELGNYFDDIEPDAVIHAAAITDTNFCQQQRDLSYAVNVEATRNIAGICCDLGIPLGFTSTDLVFDGKKGMYHEEDEKNPLSAYGEQKSIAEEELLKIFPAAIVFRIPLMYGFPLAGSSNYLQKFLAQIRSRETAKLFTDEFRSVGGAKSIAQGILNLLSINGMNTPSGRTIIHLAGKERLSRYEFGKLVAEVFDLDSTLIEPCSQKDVKMPAPRPADVSLDISKALALGYSPLSTREELKLIVANKYF